MFSRLAQSVGPTFRRAISSSPIHLNESLSSCGASYGRASLKAIAADLPPIRAHLLTEPLPYPVGLKLQGDIIDMRLRRREVGSGGSQDVMLLLEHTPTYTTGRRDNTPNPDTLHPEEKKVQNVGADFFITKRGGQVTYHGPGQLVGYPIFDLNAMDLSTRCYVEYMQRLLHEYCTDGLGLNRMAAPHKDGHVGVFAGESEKVASIGIHLRHRITSHGFAINITSEPISWFDLVTACGLADMKATSVQDLLRRGGSKKEPAVTDAAAALSGLFAKAYGREMLGLTTRDEERLALRSDTSGLDSEVIEEVEELRRLVGEAEEEARRVNKEVGGWRREPDTSKRIL